MCGCSFKPSAVRYTSTSRTVNTCEGKATTLSNERNRIAILFNVTTDAELKENYRQLKNEIEGLIKSIYSEGICPEAELISEITKEVDYEYSKYYNAR